MRHLIRGLERVVWGGGEGQRRPRRRRRALERLEERCLLTVAAQVSTFLQTNLVSDQAGVALIQDPNLINPAGIALSLPGGNFWVADNGTGVATLYNGDVNGNSSTFMKTPLTITIPGGSPLGTVYNNTSDFVVHSGKSQGAALFLFASEAETISGWNPGVPASGMGSTTAVVAATVPDAVFKGIAIGNNGTANFLYAADFRHATIDVFDKNFAAQLSGSFVDKGLPAGYAPFNIQNLGGKLYVTYALQDAVKHDDVKGAGHGFIDIFDTNGAFVRRLASGGPLNSPWGMAIAPADFGTFSNDLLVGNLGDGRINAYDPQTGAYRGQLQDELGHPIAIDGLLGLAFGNGLSAGRANALYFAAGPDSELHGLFGSLTVNPLAARGVSIQSDHGTTFSGIVATFTSTSTSAKPSDFITSITWGDHTATDAGKVSQSGGTFNVSGTHTYARSGTYTILVTIRNQAGDIANVRSTVTVGTPNELFLARVYRDLLGRTIDDAGLAYWTKLLNQGKARSDVVGRIEANSEYRSDVVRDLYATYLNRAPKTVERNRSTRFLAAGGTVEELAARLAGSTEYFRDRGGRTIDGFLAAFYHDTLGRTVDASGQGYYGKGLADGSLSPGDVARSILRSVEYRRSLVETYYRHFLHRAVDPSGLSTYAGLLKGGERDQQIIASLLGSDEYFALRT